ncbi:MAG: hypothetical protein M1286_01680 [Candidatus Marsarchaeota archaeon]|nr:hypothetical protein [Candidatus Marsarchaeota archaeon]
MGNTSVLLKSKPGEGDNALWAPKTKLDETTSVCPMCDGTKKVAEKVAISYFSMPALTRGTEAEKETALKGIFNAIERDKAIKCPVCGGTGIASKEGAKKIFDFAELTPDAEVLRG